MNRDQLLAELRELYGLRDKLAAGEGEAWVERVSEILHRLAPERARDFDRQAPLLFSGLSSYSMEPAWAQIKGVIRQAIAEAEADMEGPDTQPRRVEPPRAVDPPDPAVVFVVHGRNEALRTDLFAFLRTLHLKPLEWSEALRATGHGAPYIGEVLDAAFAKAQAVVVLLSPDDEVRLTEVLRSPEDDPTESQTLLQPRPNVLFESGMAFGSHPTRTVFVQVGQVKPFSDLAGRHLIRLDNSPARRSDLADRLEGAGCKVVRTGRDWLNAGDFTVTLGAPNEGPPSAPEQSPRADVSVELRSHGSRGSLHLVVSNSGTGAASDIDLLIDEATIRAHDIWVGNQDWPPSLRPGENFRVLLAPSMGSPVRGDVRVKWTDPDGTERSCDRMLQFI